MAIWDCIFGTKLYGRFGFYESSISNPNLGWEKNYNLNVGLDVSFINRIFLSVEYYNRDTKDLLYSLPISATTGFTNYLSNVGQLNNRVWNWNRVPSTSPMTTLTGPRSSI